ncbi:acyl-CoA reductase [Brevibacillus marinus]|uniref:acyl-CoA reductase n=1 Tax=Brevibacillus marinus TaxID=2496837 RepID=UPI000F82AEE7|nr:acyl-CoA reductase [Brevibacillus marinus]
MEIVAPSIYSSDRWQERAMQLAEKAPLEAFSDITIQFLDTFSKQILADHSMRNYPELMACAHWFRKGHLLDLKKEYEAYAFQRILKPRGTVLHFAPANVDSIFLYSWGLSMLVGNKNIIRISRRHREQMEVVLRRLDLLLAKEAFKPIAERTLLLRYDHEEEYTQFLSQICQTRVIWGGDRTVQAIRSIPLAPHATEIVFPDRYSKTIFNAGRVLECSDDELAHVAKQFYNDAFWFGQMACSSPREIYWIGNPADCTAARVRFWTQVGRIINNQGYQNPVAVGTARLATAYYYAAQECTSKVQLSTLHQPLRVEVVGTTEEMRDIHCGGGLFLERCLQDFTEVPASLHDKDQTLTYFGFAKEQLMQLVEAIPNRAIDRIVPVGQALQFGPVWDGYSFFLYFTREIIVM